MNQFSETPDLFDADAFSLSGPFADWFAAKGWQPRAHQLELLARHQRGESCLLIAPTGAGKTLAGFLPSLTALTKRPKRKPGEPKRGIHTLYISPLKALAVDIERNLQTPVREMKLGLSIETRTGDTPGHKRQRQKLNPPDILLTTPEQVSLLIANKDAERFFSDLDVVIFDELHTMVTSKRGQLLALALSRLRALRPDLRTIGLSATVAKPADLQRWLVAQGPHGEIHEASLIKIEGGAKPNIAILDSDERVPWSGHTARYAMAEIYETIKRHNTTLLFVNTRSQAELLFQELWKVNEDVLPIALHHGSLDVGQRRKVEDAMSRNALRAVVATSTLDLGIDWGDVDLVVHVGAPKGASRLAQRIGRSNHRMDEPSKAVLVPANRFEVLECRAALDANYLGDQDTPPMTEGGLDVLAQHILGMACAEPFDADELYAEITTAAPYAALSRELFDKAVDFVATGGYALRTYEQYAKIRQTKDGKWRISNPRVAQQYRLNAGTIVEFPMLDVRMTKPRGTGPAPGTAGVPAKQGPMRGGPPLGKIEEGFLESLTPGDTFLFSGQVLRFEGIRENTCFVSKTFDPNPAVPSYAGGKFPLTTYLADQVRGMIADPQTWGKLPKQVSDWLEIQRLVSILPKRDQLLIETFPRADKYYLVAHTFEGRLANQTLGMLLTRRLDRGGAQPLGFVASDYSLAIWNVRDVGEMAANGNLPMQALFDQDMLGDDLDAWLEESFLLKRTFKYCAVIAGLIEQRHPGREKSGRQMTVSSDLIYDVLRSHQPDHLLLLATRADAAYGLLDVKRLSDMLERIKGRIVHKKLERISPLSVPVMLEIGREPVLGEAQDALLAEAADELLKEATPKR